MKQIIETRLKKTFWLYLGLFATIWLMFLVNLVLPNLNVGVMPRTVSWGQLIAINTSWMFHLNFAHIASNSAVLFGILWTISVLEEKPFLVLWLLALTSGLMTWLLGAPYTSHIGASALIFAIFGYALSHAIFARKILYAAVCVFFIFNYYYGFTHGLIPQTGVSWAGHFGGFIAGIFVGFVLAKISARKKLLVT